MAVASKNAGLGRGLGALLGSDALRAGEGGSVTLRMAEVEPNTAQPRRRFDEAGLQDLAESIRTHGVLQPLLVRRLPTGYYQIVAGERRWRAARLAGLAEVPALVIDADDRKAAEIALIENLQREDLNPIEEAEGLRSLVEEYGLTQEEAAERVGRSRPALANSLRLLALPEAVRAHLIEGRLSAGHARALLPLPGAALIEKTAARVVSDGLSVRQTEALCRRLQTEAEAAPETRREPNYLAEHERRLSEGLGRRVSIAAGPKKGRLTIEFYGPEDLDALMTQLIQPE
ncbi:MAG: ParB/RepB/Spo0J family partition protein [Oscillospiraceae bacterium]|jgi:ParB family chromosome partitioning protein|nr:ParB/RepB/Spo0J family partition protein [Oscillospiraceae bacterium]